MITNNRKLSFVFFIVLSSIIVLAVSGGSNGGVAPDDDIYLADQNKSVSDKVLAL